MTLDLNEKQAIGVMLPLGFKTFYSSVMSSLFPGVTSSQYCYPGGLISAWVVLGILLSLGKLYRWFRIEETVRNV